MDFARSFAHPLVLNTEALTAFTDMTLGGSDVACNLGHQNPPTCENTDILTPYYRKEVPFVCF